MAIVAGLIAAFPPLYDWCINPTSVPLSTVVASFNKSKSLEDALQDITTEEIVTVIKSQLPTLVESERVKNILRRIASKQRVPASTAIEQVSVRRAATDQPYYSTNLHFMADGGYRQVRIRIREGPNEE